MTEAHEGGELLSFPDRAGMKAEAGAWLARLDQGPLSAEEAADFRAWLRRSPEHRHYVVKIARAFDSMGALQQLADLFPLAEVASENTRAEPGSSRVELIARGLLRPALFVAVIGAVAVAIAMLWTSPARPPDAEVFATAVGEQAKHTLTDGSVITLNTNSRVSVKYTESRRSVYLIEGEASFDVAKNPQRHFVVYAGSGLAEALGTSFNVRLSAGSVEVTVTEGQVKVLTNTTHALPMRTDDVRAKAAPAEAGKGTNDHVVLAAGQSARFDKRVESMEEKIPPEVLDRKLAWHDGAIIFSGETLQAALVEISRYTNTPLVIVDPAIAEIRIGGRYKTDDIAALLAALSSNFGIKTEEDAAGRILLSAKPG